MSLEKDISLADNSQLLSWMVTSSTFTSAEESFTSGYAYRETFFLSPPFVFEDRGTWDYFCWFYCSVMWNCIHSFCLLTSVEVFLTSCCNL